MKSKRTIKQWLVIATMTIIMVFSVVIVLNLYTMQKIAENSQQMYTNNTKSLEGLLIASREFQRMRNDVRNSILDGIVKDAAAMKAIDESLKNIDVTITNALNGFEASTIDKDILKETKTLRTALKAYEPIRNATIDKVQSGDTAVAIAVLKSDSSAAAVKNIDDSINRLVNAKLNTAEKRANENNKMASNTMNLAIVLFCIALVIAFCAVFWLNRSITKEIVSKVRPITESLNQIAQATDNNTSSVEEISTEVENINKLMQDAAIKADIVTESVKAFAKNTEIIKKIADSTKLYSLNGAIEAARTGEAGKGFIVVVNAIQELSTNTEAEAEKIEQLSNVARQEVTTLAQSIKDIAQSLDSINAATQTVASAIQEQTAMTSEIAEMAKTLQESASKSK